MRRFDISRRKRVRKMDGDKMVMRAALMAMVFAVMCAPSTAKGPATMTHRQFSPRYSASGEVGSSLDAPPTSDPEYEHSNTNGVYKLFDRRPQTTVTLKNRTGTNSVYVEYVFAKPTKINKYKIRVSRNGNPEEYPASWILYGTKSTDRSAQAGPITYIQWLHSTDGLVELHRSDPGQTFPMKLQKLHKRGYYRKYRLEITEDGMPDDGMVRVTMAEIKLTANIHQFDDPEFPGGAYPCEKTLDLLTKGDPMRGGTPFSTKSYGPSANAIEAFRYQVGSGGFLSAVYPDPPVIIGYEFNKPKTVHMYRVIYTNGGLYERALKDFEFQGSFCNEGCDRLGDEGWVTLDTVTGHSWNVSASAWDNQDQFVVPQPQPYKAYRLRITKDNYDRFRQDITAAQVGKFFLTGCTA